MRFLRVFVNLFQFNRTNWKAVFLCFFAATIFWVFNALNKQYTTNIKYPLSFEYDAEKASPLQELPASVLINVSGSGWELFREAFGYKIPSVTIPLEKPIEIKKIVGSSLPPLLANQLGKLQINYVVTDTLHLQFDQKDSHAYKLFVDLTNISFKEGYGRISPVVVLPDSVYVQGPKSLLHKLPDSVILKLPGGRLNSDFRQSLTINLPNSDLLTLNPAKAEVIFEVDEVTTVEVASAIELLNLARRNRASLSSDSVHLTVQVPIRKEEDFKKINLVLTLDLKNRKKGDYVLKPTVNNLPSYSSIIKVDSLVVTVY